MYINYNCYLNFKINLKSEKALNNNNNITKNNDKKLVLLVYSVFCNIVQHLP